MGPLWFPMGPQGGTALKAPKPPQNISTEGPSELSALWEQKGAGLTAAQLAQTRVALKDLWIAPRTFQPRNEEFSDWEVGSHVKNLQADLGKLPPILVFPIDGKRYVVDGHCRLEAWYSAATAAATSVRVVPVKLFKVSRGKPATFSDALLASVASNSKDKLPLTRDEKLEAAWKLVRYSETQAGCYSTRKIEAETGISKSTVATMMAALKQIPLGSDDDPREKSWREHCKALLPAQEWTDQKHRDLVRQVVKRLRKEFNGFPTRQPEVFAEALADAYPTADFTRNLAKLAELEEESENLADF